ncbi:DUF1846 domain-containing protein [Ruminococcaceae bacterium OttesenSCG-928-I18]|nr:DUF1846 domain-containing protein [Ruminococcaceae bacterium OttesenSCG-928-I18]
MSGKIGFNNETYITEQSKRIRERVDRFDKLYLEFGGKLFDDYHAARVLPGFDVNGKVKLLGELRDQAEIVLCISAGAIEQNKVRADIGITYDMDVMRLIDNLRKIGLYIGSVLITQYSGQPSAQTFRQKLEMRGERVYIHTLTEGYPSDVDTIVSERGYGANPFIETSRPLVVVTAPGPGSGKLATCLSQLYHEQKNGIKAGYAKYESFPVWDLPLQHPVNVAYEAATADLKDVNMIDPFHLEAYGKTAVNYNRDVEVFPVVRAILRRITGEDIYKSPTDMGVNMIGRCITNDEVVQEAARQEIIRRWFTARVDYAKGMGDLESVKRIEFLMSSLDLHAGDRRVVGPAEEKAQSSGRSAMAIELPNGQIVTGKSSELMNDTASVVLNSIKVLAGISDEILLISPIVLEPIVRLKKEILGSRYPVLKLEEVLQALSISAATNPTAELALEQLPKLRDCEAHSSDIITQDDNDAFRKLGVRLTCEPVFPTTDLYFR